MADGVQFIMDRMASIFRQMEEHEVFNKDEVRSIMKRRTDFEYVLKRRQMETGDFYKYLEYEVNLEKLLTLRCESGLGNLAGGVKTSGKAKTRQDGLRNLKGAAIRHICTIFERGIRRFPENMELVMDYVNFLKERKSNSILNEVFGRALALHPKNEDLWLQAAVHELNENNNVHAARVLLQTALRANKTSKKLWSRYFDLELWNAAKINQRQEVLKNMKIEKGIEVKTSKEDEEADQQGLIAAPSVVFKHALQAVPDSDLACQMHASCLEVSEPLSATVEEHIKSTFGADHKMWRYLLESVLVDRRHLEGAAEEEDEEGEEGEGENDNKSSKKRRRNRNRNKARGAEAIVNLCISKSKALLALLGEYAASEASASAEGKGAVLEAVSTYLHQLIGAVAVATSASNSEGGSLDSAHADQLLTAVNDVNNAVTLSAAAGTGEDLTVATLPLHASHQKALYLHDILVGTLEGSAGSATKKKKKNGAGATSAAAAADTVAAAKAMQSWLETAGKLLRNVRAGCKATQAAVEQYRGSVSAWVAAAAHTGKELGLDLSKEEDDEDEDEDDDENEEEEEEDGLESRFSESETSGLRSALFQALCDNAGVLSSVPEGLPVLAAMRAATAAIPSHTTTLLVGRAMVDAIVNEMCYPLARGTLSAAYVRWIADLSQQGKLDGWDIETAGDDFTAVLERVHSVVQSKVLKQPKLLVNAGMEAYYKAISSLAMQNCQAALAEAGTDVFRPKKNASLPSVAFARNTLALAIANDDTDKELLGAIEELERTVGDHEKAAYWRQYRDARLDSA
jgi:hypothetical protein